MTNTTPSASLQRTIARIDRAKKIDPGAWAAETKEAFQRRIEAFRVAKSEGAKNDAR